LLERFSTILNDSQRFSTIPNDSFFTSTIFNESSAAKKKSKTVKHRGSFSSVGPATKMGLDMYCFAVEKGVGNVFDLPEGVEKDYLRQWRKFYELDNWMRKLGVEKGSTNWQVMLLSAEDINSLELALKAKKLQCEASDDEDIEEFEAAIEEAELFVDEAREAMGNNKDVYYSACW